VEAPGPMARRAGAAAPGAPAASPPAIGPIVSCAPPAPSVDSCMPTRALVAEIALLVVPVLAAIVFHEVAHGAVAYGLGDPTAARHGRLTLNPLPHIDPFGTVILPALLMLAPLLFGTRPFLF